METQNITRSEAAIILNDLLVHLDVWTRDATVHDRDDILSHLFDLVQSQGLKIPYPDLRRRAVFTPVKVK